MKKRVIIPIISLIALVTWWLSDPFHTQFKPVEELSQIAAEDLLAYDVPSDSLKVMTWNIKFGGGRIDFFFECHGDRVLMAEEEVVTNLDAICALIDSINPDILFLQEVDRESKRVAGIDQLQYILNNSCLNFGVYGSQWKADVVPSNGLGNVESGNAILSKYELSSAQRIALPVRKDQDPLTQYFYLKRSLLTAQFHIGSDSLFLLSTHLTAFDKGNTRRSQVGFMSAYIDSIAKDQKVLFGGDFNLIPPVASQLAGFDDCACEDDSLTKNFNGLTDELSQLYKKFQPAISIDALKKGDAPYFTHTTKKDGYWNRKLDYLFATAGLIDETASITYQGEVFKGLDPMVLSDHAPLSTVVRFQ